jgi:hypothetical protein
MKNNKKGLSTIVATLLIILLTLVAVGIIWIVIRNVVQTGTDQVDVDSKCLAASVEATRVTNDTPANRPNYEVTILRNGGDDPLGGVKLVFTDADGTANAVKDVKINSTAGWKLDALQSKTVVVTQADLAGVDWPNKVSVVVYFLDSSGNEQLCSTANQFTFR